MTDHIKEAYEDLMLKVPNDPYDDAHSCADFIDKHRGALENALTNASEGGDEPVAVRYGWDGDGYQYIDNGSGSDWRTRHEDGEPLYTRAAPEAVTSFTTFAKDGKLFGRDDKYGAVFEITIPEGFMMVPIEPTYEVIVAGSDAVCQGYKQGEPGFDIALRTWKAMINEAQNG